MVFFKNKFKNIIIFLSVILLLNVFTIQAGAISDITECEYIVDYMRYWSGDSSIVNFNLEDFTGIDSVEVDVTRRIQHGDDDLLIFAYYSDTMKFIGMSEMVINTDFKKECTFRISLNAPAGETLSEIRVFVWNDLKDTTPLSNVLSSKDNWVINPAIEEHKYGVIDDVQYDEENSHWVITLLNEDGKTKKYCCNEATKIYDLNGIRIKNQNEAFDFLINYLYYDYENNVKRNITDRVIRYYIRQSTSEMLKLYFIPPSAATVDEISQMKEYDAYNGILDSITIGKSFTTILNFEEYEQSGRFCRVSASWMTHGTRYEAYGYDEKTDGVYPLVIITDSDIPDEQYDPEEQSIYIAKI